MLCCCPVDRKIGSRQGPKKTVTNGMIAKAKYNNLNDGSDLTKALNLEFNDLGDALNRYSKNAQMGVVTQIIRLCNLDEVDENKFISALIYTIKANNEGVVAKFISCNRFGKVSIGNFFIVLKSAIKGRNPEIIGRLIGCNQFSQLYPEALDEAFKLKSSKKIKEILEIGVYLNTDNNRCNQWEGAFGKRGSGKYRANQNILRKHGGAAVIEANKSFDKLLLVSKEVSENGVCSHSRMKFNCCTINKTLYLPAEIHLQIADYLGIVGLASAKVNQTTASVLGITHKKPVTQSIRHQASG
ncbi:MAG: hypothetical protein ACON35_03955 [Candidatus Marinamargulisbacteria bacterium]